ncbi:MAG: citronellol/citronellal dehydrogenase [Limisphaerales bacterium]|jgi:citronellol/citronellal dehydrogenase
MSKTVFITGGSRGIGKAIALRLAKEGANIIIAAKTATPHPKLPGTIYSAAEEIEAAGGKALPLVVDIRQEELVTEAVEKAVAHFGGIDILVNNASAISLTPSQHTPMKRYDLMHDINVRGTFMTSKFCIPHLLKAENPHILTLSPPLNFKPEWFGNHVAYSMSKYGMSLCSYGLAEEQKGKIGVNALWPISTIATEAVRNVLGGEQLMQASRKPEIMADAAAIIFSRDGKSCTGNFFVDQEVLASEGITDFTKYAVNPKLSLMPDLFI